MFRKLFFRYDGQKDLIFAQKCVDGFYEVKNKILILDSIVSAYAHVMSCMHARMLDGTSIFMF